MSDAMTPAAAPVVRRAFAPIDDIVLRESGSGDGSIHLQGHAAVFNRLSHDLGWVPCADRAGAFRDVLDSQPDVHWCSAMT